MSLDLFHQLFGLDGESFSWWQMSLRAVLVFAVGLVLLRLAGKRAFGRWGALDIILSVIIGSNLSRAVTGNAPLFPTLCACLVLVLLHRLLAYAAASSPLPGRWLKGTASRLVTDGEIDHRALRRHGIGDGDLEQAFRCAGARDAGEVEAAWLERDGSISVFRGRPKDERSGPD